ncbi:hypothetical protein MTO96_035005 [Rhipicephalus appendiculatus]
MVAKEGPVESSLSLRERFCTPTGACRVASRVPRFSEKLTPSLPGLYCGPAAPAAFIRFQSHSTRSPANPVPYCSPCPHHGPVEDFLQCPLQEAPQRPPSEAQSLSAGDAVPQPPETDRCLRAHPERASSMSFGSY